MFIRIFITLVPVLLSIIPAFAQQDSIVFLRSFGNGGISSYVYTTDYQQVLVGTWDGKVRLFDLKTGDTVLTYPGKWYQPFLTRSPSGKLVAVVARDSANTVSIFEMKTGVLLMQHTNGREYSKMQFSIDDSILHVTNNYRGNSIINISNNSKQYNETTYKPVLSFNGKQILSCSQNLDTLSYYTTNQNCPGPKFVCSPIWKKHFNIIDSFYFLPDGSILLTIINKKGLFFVDTATGDTVRHVMKKFKFSRLVDFQQLIPAPPPWNGTILFESDTISDTIIGVWDLYADTLVSRIKTNHHLQKILGFSEDGSHIVCRNKATTDLSFWDVSTGDSAGCLPRSSRSPFEGDCPMPQFTPDGMKILSVIYSFDPVDGEQCFIPQIWDANTGAILYTLRQFPSRMIPKLSPDGKYILTSMNMDTLLLHEVESGKFVQSFTTGRYETPEKLRPYIMSARFLNGGSTLFGSLAIDSFYYKPRERYTNEAFWWSVGTGMLQKHLSKSYEPQPAIYSSYDCLKYLVRLNGYHLYNAGNDSLIFSPSDPSDISSISDDFSSILFRSGQEQNLLNGEKKEILFADEKSIQLASSAKSPDNAMYLITLYLDYSRYETFILTGGKNTRHCYRPYPLLYHTIRLQTCAHSGLQSNRMPDHPAFKISQ